MNPRYSLTAVAAAWCALLAAPCSTFADPPTAESGEQQVRTQVAQMPASRRRELEEKRERFYRLTEEERYRMRRVHQGLSRAPDQNQLRHVLHRYAHWLQTLSMVERAELLSLPPEERVAKIKEILDQQAQRRLRYRLPKELTDNDLKALPLWLDGFIDEHREEIASHFPRLAPHLEESDSAHTRQMALAFLLRQGNWPDWLKPDAKDIDRLKADLSPKAREQLEKAQNDGRRETLATSWMRAVISSRRPRMDIDPTELQRFYREELDPRAREYLDSLPPERMQHMLRMLYESWKNGSRQDAGWPWGRFPPDSFRGRGPGSFGPSRGGPSHGGGPGRGPGGRRPPGPGERGERQ